jgi:hypothetical protein
MSFPNFNDELNLKNNSRTVAAGGPCNWAPNDDRAEIRDVRITQGNLVGTSSGSTTVRKAQHPEWWLDASCSSQFQRGPAQASALAVVRRTDGTTYNYPWSEDIQLH